MKHRIVLYDTDLDYSRRIAGYIRESDFRKEVELTVCTTIDAFTDSLERQVFDLAVANAELAEKVLDRLPSQGRMVWLTEGIGGTGPGGLEMLQKFQPVPGMLRQWIRLSGLKTVRERQFSPSVPVIAIWSAAGGVGKTKLTSAMAGVWAGKGLRLFVIGVDPGIYGAAAIYSHQYHDVSEWLFAVKTGREVERRYDEGYAPAQLHYFLPDSPYEEFIRMSRKEGAELLRLASNNFGCDAVIVDAGSGYSPFAEEVWSHCDVLVHVCADEPASKLKTEKWIQEWDAWSGQERVLEKSIFVVNKSLNERREGGFSWEHQAFRLPYVPEWKQDMDLVDPVFQQRLIQLAEEVWNRCGRQ